jgi:hypothetical protein
MASGELELDAARNVSLILRPWEGLGTVDADLRASLFVALGAALLSALVGALAGVLAGWLLLRALIFGAVMGAAALGIVRLARTFFPGLIPDSDGEGRESGGQAFAAGAAEAPAGSRVDIVLPGGEAEAESFDADAEVEEADLVEEARPEAGDGEPTMAEEPSLLDDRGPAASSAPAMPPAHMGSAGDARAPEGIDDLDVLPDLDGFTDSFAAAEFSSSGGAPASARAAPEDSASSRTSDGLDPASLAKAVRTILKRDQKG